MRADSRRSSPSGSPTASEAQTGSWQRSRPVVIWNTHTHIQKTFHRQPRLQFRWFSIWEFQMANATGTSSSAPGSKRAERWKSFLSMKLGFLMAAFAAVRWPSYVCRGWFISRNERGWKAILRRVCSVSFTAFINVCLHFCHRCSGMWKWNGVRVPHEIHHAVFRFIIFVNSRC